MLAKEIDDRKLLSSKWGGKFDSNSGAIRNGPKSEFGFVWIVESSTDKK